MTFWSRSVHMLWGLFMLISGSATLLVTFHVFTSMAIAVPGLVLSRGLFVLGVDPHLADARLGRIERRGKRHVVAVSRFQRVLQVDDGAAGDPDGHAGRVVDVPGHRGIGGRVVILVVGRAGDQPERA